MNENEVEGRQRCEGNEKLLHRTLQGLDVSLFGPVYLTSILLSDERREVLQSFSEQSRTAQQKKLETRKRLELCWDASLPTISAGRC
jgi:hypothetical protein